MMDVSILSYADADEHLKDRIEKEWGEKAARHMHLSDGFSIVALHHTLLVGLISVYRKKLPAPLSEAFDWYIDVLEVHQAYRRLGIATCLIDMVCERAKKDGVYQLRSWSSEDKIEAIPMWKALGFGLCPAVTYPQGKEVNGYFVAKVL
jgi:ribosomal protein S18 acetylase RimI-like enzyme